MELDIGFTPAPPVAPQPSISAVFGAIARAGCTPLPSALMSAEDRARYWCPTPYEQLGPAWCCMGDYHTQDYGAEWVQ